MIRTGKTTALTDSIENKAKGHVEARWGLLIVHAYYIVDLRNILKPRYIPRPLSSRAEALSLINMFFNNDRKRFDVDTGKNIAKYRVKAYSKYLKNKITRRYLNLKYEYPIHRITHQQRKDFRTMARRRMRAWKEKLDLD